MLSHIDVDALEDLSVGAAVLGTGGGGDPHLGKLMARQAIEDNGPVSVVGFEELPTEGLVVPVASMGAPTVMLEKIPSGDEIRSVVGLLEDHLGERVVAVLCAEAGGINSTIPVLAASELDLPLLDADGMGRAFPEIPMCTMNLAGVTATPMVIADEKGNVNILKTVDNTWTERLARAITIEMGCSSVIALYPMSVATARDATIAGTMELAVRIGRTLHARGSDAGVRLTTLLTDLQGHLLFRGKVADVYRRTVTGFARGRAELHGTGHDADSVLTLEFQNEHLVALRNGHPVATVPDLISVLDAESLRPITTEGLAYGQRVRVIGLPCAPIWQEPEALEIVGPRYFGYDLEYVPLQQLAEGEADV